MRLNKFFALNTHYNRQEDEEDALAGSGGSSSGGTRAPLNLSIGQVQSQIDLLNAELRRKYPDLDPNSDELRRLKEQAYAEFLEQVQTNPALNVSEEVFANALTIPLDQARSQYYNFDFTGKDRLGLESRTPAIIDQIGSYNDGSVFKDPSDRTFLPPMLTQEDVQAATQFDTLNPSYAAKLAEYLPPEEQRLTSVSQDSPAFTTADSLPSTLFDSINFPAQEITRGTPVVTRGLMPDGSPTTAITMGQSTATPSGPDIGELTTYTQFPSTGMGINPDGTGTTTVGTQDTTGNIVATGADEIIQFGSPLVSSVDPNVVNIGTGVGGTNTTGTVGVSAGFPLPEEDAPITGGPITGGPITGGPITGGPSLPKVPLTEAAIIQNLFNTSQTKDIAAQRIGDYAASVGGITAESIASAVAPILSGEIESPNTFGIIGGTGSADEAAVMDAVNRFGYGQVYGGENKTGGAFDPLTGGISTFGSSNPSFITENPLPRLVETMEYKLPLSPAEQLAQNNERLQYLNTQDAAIGTGAYTEQEAAMRGLDFAKRQGMTLDQAGSGFGLDEAGVREKADELGIDLSALGFKDGGEVQESRQSALDSRFMSRAGLGSLQGNTMSPAIAGTLDRIMARRK